MKKNTQRCRPTNFKLLHQQKVWMQIRLLPMEQSDQHPNRLHASQNQSHDRRLRLAPVLKTIFHQCVISFTCSRSNSDGSVSTDDSATEFSWLTVDKYWDQEVL